jgi:putative SOS response-associated peptidase YedK
MLTVKADEHPLMRMFHKPVDEKRMVVILPPERYQDWLSATPEHSMALIHHSAAVTLCAMPVIG